MTTVTFDQVLGDALAAENGAAKFYDRLAERASDPRARKLFLALAVVQRAHCTHLAVEGRKLIDGPVPRPSGHLAALAHVASGWEDIDELSYDESLQIALECHERAFEYYETLSQIFDEEFCVFFTQAAATERRYIHMIEDAKVRQPRRQVHALTLPHVLGAIASARRATAHTFQRLADRATESHVRDFLKKMSLYQMVRADEVEGDESWEPYSDPAFVLDSASLEREHLSLRQAMHLALEVEEKAASYGFRVAAGLRGEDARVVRKIATEAQEHGRLIASAIPSVVPRPSNRRSLFPGKLAA